MGKNEELNLYTGRLSHHDTVTIHDGVGKAIVTGELVEINSEFISVLKNSNLFVFPRQSTFYVIKGV